MVSRHQYEVSGKRNSVVMYMWGVCFLATQAAAGIPRDLMPYTYLTSQPFCSVSLGSSSSSSSSIHGALGGSLNVEPISSSRSSGP